jgi:hypothetical protein
MPRQARPTTFRRETDIDAGTGAGCRGGDCCGAAKPSAPEYSLATITGYVSKNALLFGPKQRIHITCMDDIEVSDKTLTRTRPWQRASKPGSNQDALDSAGICFAISTTM